jgi:sec-independent protein translocase protein TatC
VDDTARPLTDHLAELRGRLAKALLAWGVAAFAAWSWREEIFAWLLAPALAALAPSGGELQAIAPTEIFFTYFKSALLAGFVLALPVILWQLWAFVAPGLYDTEKRVAVPFVASSTLLFVAGCLFGHRIVFPKMFAFFAAFQNELVTASWTMREVYAMTTNLFLAFGLAFQLPVILVFLAVAGIVDGRQLLGYGSHAVVLAFVVGAVLTPADVISQVFLSVPLVGLYFLGVGGAFLFGRRRKEPDAAEGRSLQAQ